MAGGWRIREDEEGCDQDGEASAHRRVSFGACPDRFGYFANRDVSNRKAPPF